MLGGATGAAAFAPSSLKPSTNLCNSACRSRALWNLLAGFFSSSFSITASRPADIDSGRIVRGGTGFSVRCFESRATADSATKGSLPVAIWYINTPREYRSDRPSSS